MDLKSRFAVAERIRKDLQSDPLPGEKARKAYDEYLECRAMVDRLGLFSPNELLEDINTSDLQYVQSAEMLSILKGICDYRALSRCMRSMLSYFSDTYK